MGGGFSPKCSCHMMWGTGVPHGELILGPNSSIFKAGIERKLRQTFHFPRLQAEGGFTVVTGGLLFRSVGYIYIYYNIYI